ncbi:hypothetical protein F4779DRAFT_635192 [Xylariaceae sp. FL0662B]|nr:hypothetical protein F4779DRAFT_635192 [Xylariaceae sp. FL0662B]
MSSSVENEKTVPSSLTVTARENIRLLLPTCQRCRRLRRKCDTQLPNCRLCEKAGVECAFQDHVLKQVLPRKYVDLLLVRLDQLRAVKNSITASPLQAVSSSSANDSIPTPAQQASMRSEEPTFERQPISFDVVVPSRSTAGKSRYWGSSSVFALAVEIIHHAYTKDLISPEDSPIPETGEDREESAANDGPFHRDIAPASADDVQALVSLYMLSINTLYGFVDESAITLDTRAYLLMREQPDFLPQALNGTEAHQYFRITMICAISCANQARYYPSRAAESLAYYSDAVRCVEEVTSEVSPASLQALLLLIVFCLFYPRNGDIWKLLDYACRLAVELGYHTEQEQGSATTSADSQQPAGDEKRKKLRRSTFWGLYAIERIVGQLFGRGTDLPETIITTEYPSALAESPAVDQASLQPMSIAHHYRLVYLRSELFRAMYLPASPPRLSVDWLRDKYSALYTWRKELAISDELTGVATITCDVGYDATICFLFQPSMLRALRATQGSATKGSSTGPGISEQPFVAADSFWSSYNLIRTYEKVIRAPEGSVLGTYPMTFMSAHYIWIASSTLLAHAVLAVDGRTKVLPRFSNDAAFNSGDSGADGRNSEIGNEDIDYGVFVDISGSCLVLLSWCVERWPGMAGMLDVYKWLFKRLTRELIRKGLVV